jgi:hypothetical protein
MRMPSAIEAALDEAQRLLPIVPLDGLVVGRLEASL